MAQHGLFVLKVPLNPNQPTNQTTNQPTNQPFQIYSLCKCK